MEWPTVTDQLAWFMRGFFACMGFVITGVVIRVFRKLGDSRPEL